MINLGKLLKTSKTALLIAVTGCLLLTACSTGNNDSNSTAAPEPTATATATDSGEQGNTFDEVTGYGLHIEADGTVTLGGEIFYGYGTNWHGAFDMAFGGASELRLAKFFKVLHDEGFPYARIMMGVFYDYQVPNYIEKTEKYFKAMDRVVKLAEQYNIGIIASLMWNDSAFYTYSGETLKQLGDPEAKGTKLAIQYVTDVVTRYKDSPAIWAWEIGNEGNLGVDLWPEHGTVHSSQQLKDYYTIVSDTIYSIDSYRMISGGDGCPRDYSHSLRNGYGWGYKDTVEYSKDTLTYYNPGHMRAASMHVYEYFDADRFDDLVKACRELNLCCYVGEFGAGNYTANNPMDKYTADELPEEAEEQKCWNYVVDALLRNDIQLATQWCFGRNAQIEDGTSIEYGMTSNMYQNVYQLTRLKEINANLVAEGKNKSASYWASATNLLYNPE